MFVYGNKTIRSHSCNPDRLLSFRKGRSWNQRQLADASGLSQRVISKAESGESLSPQSIVRIAEALTTEALPIFPEDLVTNQLVIAKAYVEMFYSHQVNISEKMKEFFTSDVTFEFSGDESKIPFAGLHRGLNEFGQAIRNFYRLFTIGTALPESAYEFYEKDKQVVFWGSIEIGLAASDQTQPVVVAMRFHFNRGKISHVDCHVDFHAATGGKS